MIIYSASYYYGASFEEVIFPCWIGQHEIFHGNFPTLVARILMIDNMDYWNTVGVFFNFCYKRIKDLVTQWVPSHFCFSVTVTFFFLSRRFAWWFIPVLLYQHLTNSLALSVLALDKLRNFWQVITEILGNKTKVLMSKNYIFGMYTSCWAGCWGPHGHDF